ncbi:hypothetical protein [Corynebacterium variabile]|uniref:hypothetical protein n=1 Tax=Corynebacterium variabile TaxID=1727 RepID=UPI00289D0E76|nr:hypothetical protein [Corynebacterium variabile]
MQGREDPWNPFDGGEVIVGEGVWAESRGTVHSAADSARWFAERNGAGDQAEPTRDEDAEITDWPGEHPFRLIAVDHSGHSFPTTTGRWATTTEPATTAPMQCGPSSPPSSRSSPAGC